MSKIGKNLFHLRKGRRFVFIGVYEFDTKKYVVYTANVDMMLIFLLFVAVVSSIIVEGKQAIYGNVELKWKVEVLSIVNYMTMILQMDGGALGVLSVNDE